MDHRTLITKDRRGHTRIECREITLVQSFRIFQAGSRRWQMARDLWLDGYWTPDPATALETFGSRDQAVFAAGRRFQALAEMLGQTEEQRA